jgi:hypothetical protein
MDVWAYILEDGVTVAATMDINSIPQDTQTSKFNVENLGKTNFKVVNGQIVIDEDKNIIIARNKKLQQIANNCGQSIIAGFKSGNNSYGSQTTDQYNIHTAAKYGGYLWTLDSSNNWLFIQYTIEEAQQIENDLHTFIQNQQTIYANLMTQINNSTDINYIESLSWPS